MTTQKSPYEILSDGPRWAGLDRLKLEFLHPAGFQRRQIIWQRAIYYLAHANALTVTNAQAVRAFLTEPMDSFYGHGSHMDNIYDMPNYSFAFQQVLDTRLKEMFGELVGQDGKTYEMGIEQMPIRPGWNPVVSTDIQMR